MRNKILFVLVIYVLGNATHLALAEHSSKGYLFDIPRIRPSLPDRTPEVHFPVNGLDEESQRLVNASIEVALGFWTYEAERLMREVIKRNSLHPMPYVLNAYIQTIFSGGDYERGKAYMASARKCLEVYELDRRERMWLDTISSLFDEQLPNDHGRSQSYILKLESLVENFDEDLEAKTFLALAYWLEKVNNGISKSQIIPGKKTTNLSTEEDDKIRYRAKADQLIEAVLKKSPKHPVHHLKIHLWNNDEDDLRALDSARECSLAQAQTAHLWHMPAHIFTNTRDYGCALKHMEIAHRVDHKQLFERKIMPTNVHNYYHNFRDYGLRIKGITGQIDDAIERGSNMLKFGRLPFQRSRHGHAILANKLLERIEQYNLWIELNRLIDGGYFDNLSTEDKDRDRELVAKKLRLRVRANTSNDDRFQKNRALVAMDLEKLEALRNEGILSEGKDCPIVKYYDDAWIWKEIAIRKKSLGTNLYYINKLEALGQTRASEILLLANDSGHYDRASQIATSILSDRKTIEVSDYFNLLAYFSEIGDLDQVSRLTTFASKLVLPPVTLSDFRGLRYTHSHPHAVTRIIQQAEDYSKQWQEHVSADFRYLVQTVEDDFGPANPLHYTFAEYQNDNSTTTEILATPASGKYKLLVFVIGAACPACNTQLHDLLNKKDSFSSLDVEIVVISQMGTELDEFHTVIDESNIIHRTLGAWDEFLESPLHGIFLINDNRQVLWDSITEHAITDIDFLVEESQRVITLNRP